MSRECQVAIELQEFIDLGMRVGLVRWCLCHVPKSIAGLHCDMGSIESDLTIHTVVVIFYLGRHTRYSTSPRELSILWLGRVLLNGIRDHFFRRADRSCRAISTGCAWAGAEMRLVFWCVSC